MNEFMTKVTLIYLPVPFSMRGAKVRDHGEALESTIADPDFESREAGTHRGT